MEQVLLVDSDSEHARAMASALRSISCQATICAGVKSAMALMRRCGFAAIVVVAVPGASWTDPIEAIRHVAFQAIEPPQIICLLRGPYRGPTERVYAARKGFKVIYEG